ncbi:MAG TPA: hypothetical protein VLZ83_11440 [Edaphocola sp.]|nr:hypothetical protein [Edaphocola sp.]
MSNESVEQVHFDNLLVGQESGSFLEETPFTQLERLGEKNA